MHEQEGLLSLGIPIGLKIELGPLWASNCFLLGRKHHTFLSVCFWGESNFSQKHTVAGACANTWPFAHRNPPAFWAVACIPPLRTSLTRLPRRERDASARGLRPARSPISGWSPIA